MMKRLRGLMVWMFWFGFAIVVPSLPMYVVYLRRRHENQSSSFGDVLSVGDLVLIAMVLPLGALGEALPEIVKNRRGLGRAFKYSCLQLWKEFRELFSVLCAVPSSNDREFAQRYFQVWANYRAVTRNYSQVMDLAFLPLLVLAAILIAVASGGIYVQFLEQPKPTAASVAIYVIAAALAVQLHQIAGKLSSLVKIASAADQDKNTEGAPGGGAAPSASTEQQPHANAENANPHVTALVSDAAHPEATDLPTD